MKNIHRLLVVQPSRLHAQASGLRHQKSKEFIGRRRKIMRSVQRYAYSILAIVGVWQCLVSAVPAAADSIPFFITNQFTALRILDCGGPWLRGVSVDVPSGTANHKFYEAEFGDFTPLGKWSCAIWSSPRLLPLSSPRDRVFFDIGRNVIDVRLTIDANGKIQVQVADSPPRSLPPQALIKLTGSASNVGDSRPGRSAVKLSGKVNTSTPPALDLAIVTIDALFHEVEGAEELINGLPLVLAPLAGSEADEATYESAPGIRPKARLDVRLNGNKPAEFKLKLEKASIPQFPQQCVPELDGDEHTTGVALRFTIDDGVAVPLVVEGAVEVECSGNNPQLPTELTVQELVPIEPQPPAP
jgi:hypothetical protein